jgi:hypothetical protein
MKKKFAILTGGAIIAESDTVTDAMKRFIRVNPAASIIQRSRKSHLGYIFLNLN